jgi:hypothetical protein
MPYITVCASRAEGDDLMLVNRTIGTAYTPDSHTAANIAADVRKFLAELGIDSSRKGGLFSATTDTTASMPAAVRELGLLWKMCDAHVLNLVLKCPFIGHSATPAVAAPPSAAAATLSDASSAEATPSSALLSIASPVAGSSASQPPAVAAADAAAAASVVDSAPSTTTPYGKLLERVRRIVIKINGSKNLLQLFESYIASHQSDIAAALKQFEPHRTGKKRSLPRKLKSYPETRFNYCYLTIRRVLVFWAPLQQFLLQPAAATVIPACDRLSVDDYPLLVDLNTILARFQSVFTTIQAANHPTLSLSFVSLLLLHQFLQKPILHLVGGVQTEYDEVKALRECLRDELHRRVLADNRCVLFLLHSFSLAQVLFLLSPLFLSHSRSHLGSRLLFLYSFLSLQQLS